LKFSERAITEMALKVTRGNRQWHYSTDHTRLPISVL